MTAYNILDTIYMHYVCITSALCLHYVFIQMCKAHRATADASRAHHAMVTAVAIHVQDHPTGWSHFTIRA